MSSALLSPTGPTLHSAAIGCDRRFAYAASSVPLPHLIGEPLAPMTIALPSDPSDEELARDWLLSEQDLVEVRRCRSDDKRHSFAIQLCALRAYGRFLGRDFTEVPVRIVNHLGRQLGMPPVLFVVPPSRKQTDTEHERRIREYLSFRSFDDDVRGELARWLSARAAEGMLGDELVVRAEHPRPAGEPLPRNAAAVWLVWSPSPNHSERVIARSSSSVGNLQLRPVSVRSAQ